jgi:hypothetical protein
MTMSGPGVTVGPPFSFWAWPLATVRMPLNPDSDEPIESVMIRFGK